MRKVKVLIRDDSQYPTVRQYEKVIESDQTRAELETHAHILAVLEDPVKETKEVTVEEVKEPKKAKTEE